MRVIGAAFNFKGLEHESGVPILFYKTHDPEYVWEGKENSIILPKEVKKVWAEVEVAFSILKAGDKAVIEGYAVANDITADYGADCHFLLGKSRPSFCKIARPWSFVKPNFNGRMIMRVNGTLLQDGRLREMIIQPQALVTLIDRRIGLETGDIVLSGTPFHTASPLRKGDTVEVEVEGLGNIVSKVKI